MEWLELAAEAGAEGGCPLRMRAAWRARAEPLPCARCGREIGPGELFTLAARCEMGGAVEIGERLARYADLLEARAEHLRCLAPERAAGESVCYTIGHGTRPFDESARLLERYGIEVLADIRTVPKSRRNPQYGQEALAASLKERGFCYLHLPELGGLRKPRADSPNRGWRNESFRGYADYMLTPAFEAAAGELIALVRRRVTAIMCAESVHWRCHRSLVADALFVRGVRSCHILPNGELTPHRLPPHARPEGERVLYPGEAAESQQGTGATGE